MGLVNSIIKYFICVILVFFKLGVIYKVNN